MKTAIAEGAVLSGGCTPSAPEIARAYGTDRRKRVRIVSVPLAEDDEEKDISTIDTLGKSQTPRSQREGAT